MMSYVVGMTSWRRTLGGDADGVVGEFFNADFHRIVVEDARVFGEYILQDRDCLVMVVIVADIEEEGNKPFVQVGAVRDLGRGDERVGDEYGFVVLGDDGRVQHLNGLDAAFNAADIDPVPGLKGLKNEDEQA